MTAVRTRLRSRMGRVAILAGSLMLLASAAPAGDYSEYDDSHTGHPLRIIAYVVHPIGVILDYLIFRPTYWLFSHEPLETLVGQQD